MINELFLRNYFQALAETSKDIVHTPGKKSFYRMQLTDLDEFDGALRDFSDRKGLILEIGSGSFGSEDNIIDNADVSLFFVIRTSGNYDEMDTARQEAKTIAKKFMARIRYDLTEGAWRPDGIDGPLIAQKLKFNSSGKYRNLGILGDGLWTGKIIDIAFTGQGESDNAYHPEDWL